MLSEQCKQLGCTQLGAGRSFGQVHPACLISHKVPESGCPCGLEDYMDDRLATFQDWKKRRNAFLVRTGVIKKRVTEFDPTKLKGLPAEVLLDYLVSALKLLLEGGRLR